MPRTQPSPQGALAVFRERWGQGTIQEAVDAAARDLTKAFEAHLPIDPAAVAARFGAKVINVPLDSLGTGDSTRHGELAVVKDRWQISVPSDVVNERRRFSIAHEIGHILLFDAVAEHADLVRELRRDSFHSYVEALCNQIAARILMPSVPFSSAITRLGGLGSADLLTGLSDTFWVSAGAAARRLVELEPSRRLLIWDYVLDHPRGPAWRTAKEQDRSRGPYIPDGLSSRRLRPDVVDEAAELGVSSAAAVKFDAPNLSELKNVHAYRQRQRPKSSLPLSEFDSQRIVTPRVYLVHEIPLDSGLLRSRPQGGRI